MNKKQKRDNNDAVIIFSGGLDSTVLLWQLIRDEKQNIHAITFDYGQRFNREIQVSKDIIKYANSKIRLKSKHIKHIIINLKDLSKVYPNSKMIGNKKVVFPNMLDIKDKDVNQESYQFSHIPFRNAIFLSIAVSYAQSIKCNMIYYAAHKSLLGTVFPDCTQQFILDFRQCAQTGTGNPDIKIIAPFVNMTKDKIITFAKYDIDLRLPKNMTPLEKTYSCYSGTRLNCGICNNCVPRIEAFKKAGVDDKTPYQKVVLEKTPAQKNDAFKELRREKMWAKQKGGSKKVTANKRGA